MYTHGTTSPFLATSDRLLSPLTIQVISLPLLCRNYQQTLKISRGLEDSYSKVVVNVIDLALNWQLFSDLKRPQSFVNVMSTNSTLW